MNETYLGDPGSKIKQWCINHYGKTSTDNSQSNNKQSDEQSKIDYPEIEELL